MRVQPIVFAPAFGEWPDIRVFVGCHTRKSVDFVLRIKCLVEWFVVHGGQGVMDLIRVQQMI